MLNQWIDKQTNIWASSVLWVVSSLATYIWIYDWASFMIEVLDDIADTAVRIYFVFLLWTIRDAFSIVT